MGQGYSCEGGFGKFTVDGEEVLDTIKVELHSEVVTMVTAMISSNYRALTISDKLPTTKNLTWKESQNL